MKVTPLKITRGLEFASVKVKVEVPLTAIGLGENTLVIVNVSVDVPPARMGFGENNFVMLGGFNTMSPAVALPVDPVFVPPFVEEINPLTF